MGILDVFKSKTKDLTDQAGGATTAVKERTGDLTGPANTAPTSYPTQGTPDWVHGADDDTDKLPRL